MKHEPDDTDVRALAAVEQMAAALKSIAAALIVLGGVAGAALVVALRAVSQ